MNNINFVIMESAIETCLSMQSYIDKLYSILEYCDDEEYVDDLISEAYEIYLEATQRRKKADEIDRYIRDKKLGDVNSKNSSKSKSARKIRNFLVQHDFDPKTETIKSDIPGKRVEFHIDRSDRYNGEFNEDYDRILIGKNVFNKQSDLQQTASHEKAHHMFSNITPSGKSLPFVKDPNNPDKDYVDDEGYCYLDRSKSKSYRWMSSDNKNERGIKHLNEYKSKGWNINDHDDGTYKTDGNQSPEELEADLHAVKTARIRTKYAGRKRAVKRSGATRNLNDNEIRKNFEELARLIKRSDLYKQFERDKSDVTIPKFTEKYLFLFNIKSIINNLKTKDQAYDLFMKIKSAERFLKDDFIDNRFYSSIDIICSNMQRTQENIDQSMSHIAELYKQKHSRYKNDRTQINDETIEIQCKHLLSLRNELASWKKEYDNESHKFKEANIKLDTSFFKNLIKLSEMIYQLTIGDKNLNSNKHHNTKFNINQFIDNTLLNDIYKLKTEVNYRHKLDDIEKNYKKRLIKLYKICMDESTQMRYDFVKKYVHESFEELFDEYYSLENFDIYLEG